MVLLVINFFAMKKYYLVIVGLLALMGGACSSDSEPGAENGIQGEVIVGLQQLGSAATYTIESRNLYNRDSGSGGRWESVSFDDGYTMPLPASLVFQDGKLWSEAKYFSMTSGPEMLGMLWDAYCARTNERRRLFVGYDFSFDESMKALSVESGFSLIAEYNVETFNEQRLTLNCVTRYEGGHTGQGGDRMFKAVYRRTSDARMDSNGILAFDSQYDCDRYVWEKAYSVFGRYVDLNECFGPEVIFDNPVVDLDAIEPKAQ